MAIQGAQAELKIVIPDIRQELFTLNGISIFRYLLEHAVYLEDVKEIVKFQQSLLLQQD
ncbi:hypothetical protein ACFQY8_06135 [Alloscardovia venturai]|uniref:Uncharacterized protein n=1 Tax=Alloscardovia venturai TaxID=1769421 RepID=A0ABW2Y5H5_9BIFI